MRSATTLFVRLTILATTMMIVAETTEAVVSSPRQRRQRRPTVVRVNVNVNNVPSFRSHRRSDATYVARRTRKRSSATTTTATQEEEEGLVPHDDHDGTADAPSLEEMRASLGPIGRSIANGVELGIVTGGSYLSGGILGYGVGGLLGVRKLVSRGGGAGAAEEGVRRTLASELKRRTGEWHGAAWTSAGRWAELSAAFSGFHAASRVLRGREDSWNGVLGSTATGVYLSRANGPRAMIQSGLSYGGIAFLLDGLGGGGGSTKQKKGDKELEFSDTPVQEEDV